MIKAIIFDFFDVIRQDAFHAWMSIHGFTREDPAGEVSRRLDTGIINMDQFYQELAQLSGQTTQDLLNEFAQNEKFNHEVIDYIRELRKSYKTALLSNAESDYLRNILNEKELEQLFDIILISSEIGIAKPDPKMFELALTRLNIHADEAVFIDDQLKNIHAAESVGIKGIQFEDIDKLREALGAIL